MQMNVSGTVILQAKPAQRWVYEVASSGYSSRLVIFTMAMYLAPSGRGRHASRAGRMLLWSGQPFILVFTTNSLGGGGGSRCAWQGSSCCPPRMVLGGGSPAGCGRDDEEGGLLCEGPAPDEECPRLSFDKNRLSCDAGRACSHHHSHSHGPRDIPGHIHDPLEDRGSSSLEGWAPGLPPGGGSSSGGRLPPPLPLPLFPPLPLLLELPGKLGGQPHGGPPL
jgi:hypothetical protein